MIEGIIIGVSVAAVIFVVVWMLRKPQSPTLYTYLILVGAMIILAFEGIKLDRAFNARRNTDNIVSLVQDAVLTCVPSDGLDYVIKPSEAYAVKLAVRLISPSVARRLDVEDISGKTVAEATDVIRKSIIRNESKMMVVWIIVSVISLIILTGLMYLSFGNGSRGGGSRGDTGRQYSSRRIRH